MSHRRVLGKIPTHGTFVLIKTKELVFLGHESRCVNRAKRIVGDTVKLVSLSPTIYATYTGSTDVAEELFQDLRKKINKSGDEPRLKEIADYGQQRVQASKERNGECYAVIGTEDGKPEAYVFSDKYEASWHLTTWGSFGTGKPHADKVLQENYDHDLSEPVALKLTEKTLLEAALDDPLTGGYIRVSVFGSNGLMKEKESSHSTLELYLREYALYDEFHPKTIYIFSRGQLQDKQVTKWFSSGFFIQPVDVMVSHAIGSVGGYIISRVVLQNKYASTVIQDVQHQCEEYGCHDGAEEGISRFPCFQILTELFHFAMLTEKELSDLLGIYY